MDPAQKRKATKRIEIVRESGSNRRMRLSDIMSESFSKYLMDLDGDFIAPTGARLSDLLEALKQGGGEYSPDVVARAQGLQQDPTEDPGKYLARAERELSATSPIARGAPMLPDVPDDKDQNETQPPAVTQPPPVARPPATAPTKVEPAVAPPAEEESDVVVKSPITTPAAPTLPPSDDDNARNLPPGGGDISTVNNAGRDNDSEPDNQSAVALPNPDGSDAADPIEDAAGTGVNDGSQGGKSDELGGPDEFDEKNKPFTDYMNSLISGQMSGEAGSATSTKDTLPEGRRRATRSLLEAVYGSSRTIVIDRR